MGKLTKTAIDALAIPAKGQVFLWDSELRGFGVRVIPSGLNAFVVQYRNEEVCVGLSQFAIISMTARDVAHCRWPMRSICRTATQSELLDLLANGQVGT